MRKHQWIVEREKEPFVNVGVIRNANFTKDFKLDYSNIEYIDVEQRTFAKTSFRKMAI